jgi:hypothetical protein
LEKVQIAVEDPEQVKFWIAFYKTKGIDFFSTEVKEDSEPEESFESAATGESGKTA